MHLNGQIHFKIFSTYCYTNFKALIFDFQACFILIILLMSYHQQFQISFFLHYYSQLHVFVFLRSPAGLRLYLGLAPQLICLPAVSASRHLQRSGVWLLQSGRRGGWMLLSASASPALLALAAQLSSLSLSQHTGWVQPPGRPTSTHVPPLPTGPRV